MQPLNRFTPGTLLLCTISASSRIYYKLDSSNAYNTKEAIGTVHQGAFTPTKERAVGYGAAVHDDQLMPQGHSGKVQHLQKQLFFRLGCRCLSFVTAICPGSEILWPCHDAGDSLTSCSYPAVSRVAHVILHLVWWPHHHLYRCCRPVVLRALLLKVLHKRRRLMLIVMGATDKDDGQWRCTCGIMLAYRTF